MKFKQEVHIKGIPVFFWLKKQGDDDIVLMAEVIGEEPIRLLRLRPDGALGLFKITNTKYPFDLDADGYIQYR